jgi:hypothetical protein
MVLTRGRIRKKCEEKETRERLTREALAAGLIPGVEDDVTLMHIVKKVAGEDIRRLSGLNGGWHSALADRQQLLERRVCSGSAETLAVVCVKFHDHTNSLALYSLKRYRLSYLPAFPDQVRDGYPWPCKIVALGSKLYVLGGFVDHEDRVYSLDFAVVGKMQWKRCASMLEGRYGFACCAIGRKIHVIGGVTRGESACGSAEMYIPGENDRWVPSPSAGEMRNMHNAIPIGNELVLQGGWKLTNAGWQNARHLLEIFNTETGEWRTEEFPFQLPRIDSVLGRGKRLYFVGRSDIHVYTIGDKASFTKMYSNLTKNILEKDEAGRLLCESLFAQFIDCELFAVSNWVDGKTDFPETILVSSSGFGKKNDEILWHRGKPLWRGFKKHNRYYKQTSHFSDIKCTIQL